MALKTKNLYAVITDLYTLKNPFSVSFDLSIYEVTDESIKKYVNNEKLKEEIKVLGKKIESIDESEGNLDIHNLYQEKLNDEMNSSIPGVFVDNIKFSIEGDEYKKQLRDANFNPYQIAYTYVKNHPLHSIHNWEDC